MRKSIARYFPVFVLPTLLAFTLFFVAPFLMGIGLSFTKFTTVTNAKWVGLGNYIKAFTFDSEFVHALGFTSLFTVVSMVTVNVIAFSFAILLTKKIRGTTFFRSVFFLPNLIGGIVLGYIWNLMINGVLSVFNVDITFKTEYGFWGLVILTNWQLVGYMMVIYIAGLQNVPDELLEAAEIDGASAWDTLFHVKLPIVMPSVTICTFLTLANTFKMFDQNLALTAGAPENTTEMLALNIYNTFYGRTGWQGVGQAKAVIFFLIVALLAFLQLKLTSRKEIEQ
ncbi:MULTISPECIES: carbohydrate ABC transporter permease [Treponema]|jgi:raffinose/stachyose/melibiose transport system permease protein|uniref:Carbohydrate ABC transporter membrane protein 1, CUT1 family n=1 Tax=Treponema saccharophilum DSM 2985 TaxID=907348 RepID=H7EPL5_9SPIR|nr:MULTISPECIES: sugar ABC transporter permease [Treponema]EIC00416.1 carbohydrate ABC transporter membrane protein 1, CUT1 family [Treponema saccharophilum DSM 2985]MBQ5538106.1 sugar ABC transporter permease [Treponema sp.]BDC94952.1 ABC transporter permease [Treponema saccharophilum]